MLRFGLILKFMLATMLIVLGVWLLFSSNTVIPSFKIAGLSMSNGPIGAFLIVAAILVLRYWKLSQETETTTHEVYSPGSSPEEGPSERTTSSRTITRLDPPHP